MKQNETASPEQRAHALTPGALVLRRFRRNRLANAGLVILILMFAFSFLGGLLSPYGQSQVFQRDETIMKDYATCAWIDEPRYTLREGATLPETARAAAALAMTRGESNFSDGEDAYSLLSIGNDAYLVSGAEIVARARTVAGRFVLTIEEPAALDDAAGFASAAESAILAGDAQLESQGTLYIITTAGKTHEILRMRPLALAAKHAFAPAGPAMEAVTASFAFRLALETALAEGAGSFESGSVRYTLQERAGDTLVSGGDPAALICTVSDLLVSPSAEGASLSPAFEAAARHAIRTRQDRFTEQGTNGEPTEYRVERGNAVYAIRTMTRARVITMYQPPSREHILGTDGNGMDVLTRLMYGGRVSLAVGFVVVFLEVLLGVFFGGISGYFGGWVDTAMMRFVDLFNCIPFYPVVIIIGTVMDKMEINPSLRIFVLMAVLGLMGWTGIARVVRGQILSLREQDFMLAAEATGLSAARKIGRHLLPNVMPLLIVQATMNLGGIIIAEATLSFLGLGVKYPLASWGSIINAATNVHVMTNAWFVWIPAGLLIVLTVLGFNFVGDGLRDAYDPRMKG
ncbi:MAG: ABC transporter permease [Christensenella sp.]|nr:ABC transporter permease [Christensenella sp.]